MHYYGLLRITINYVKNQCKWKAASEFAADKNWKFVIWTEDTIKGMGIVLLT